MYVNVKRCESVRIARMLRMLEESKREVGEISKRERFMFGLDLYVGDEEKGDRGVGFVNSRPEIISFMMKWFRDFCGVEESRFRGRIWLHDGLDERKAVSFWSGLTDTPQCQFHKVYIAKVKKRLF